MAHARFFFFPKPAIERRHYRQLFSPPISTILNEVQGGGLEREIPIVRGCPYFLKLVSSLTSNISMHILHSIPLYSSGAVKENSCNNQECLYLVIISSILMTLIFDSGATLLREIRYSHSMTSKS